MNILTILGILFLIWMYCIIYTAPEDPCDKCPVYKYENCVFVDSSYCNMETCSILQKFNKTHVIADNGNNE